VEADLVMGVPESGVPAAEGFARATGIPHGQALVKNRYIGRTFITPGQGAREESVRRKLNPLRENIEGKRIVVVDDTIVRGTTQRAVVRMLREAGAREVHLRISCPPVTWPCFYGIDIPNRDELIAAKSTIAELEEYLGVDSLAYLSLDNLVTAIAAPGAGFCSACLTGDYPAPVPVSLTALSSTHPRAVAPAPA
jgi:amidophosphoribosyltransferase